MAFTAPKPGTGIDRRTGKVLSGWPHVRQSIGVIFTTHFGERVMRRWVGSLVPDLLGQNLSQSAVLRFWTAICIAIDTYEPRFKVTKIQAAGTDNELRTGKISFIVAGIYYPRGHLGDFTVSTPQSFPVVAAGGLIALVGE